MDIKEVRANAKERMKGFAVFVPVCDGRACAGGNARYGRHRNRERVQEQCGRALPASV